MKRIIITINTTTSRYDINNSEEISKLLKRTANCFENNMQPEVLCDSSGNIVGNITYE